MKKKIGMIAILLAATLIVGAVGLSMASDYSDTTTQEKKAGEHKGYRNGDCTEEPKLNMMNRLNLTDEQEQEIRDTVISMRDDGADRDEIRDTVNGMLEEYGAELPRQMSVGRLMRQRRGLMHRSQRDMHRRGRCSGEN